MSQDIKFSDIKTINYNSPSKNLVNIEPDIVRIPAYDECGSGINLDWYKAYSLYVPELPLGIDWINLYFDRYPDFLNPQSIVHFHDEGEQFYEMRHGEKISNTVIVNLDGYEGGSISFDSTVANGSNIRASVSPARVKTYELTLASLPVGVESYTITRTPGLTGAAATQSFTVPGTSGKPIIYHGDTLTVSVVAKSGFNPAESSFSNLTNNRVVGPSTLTVTSGGPKQFSLKVSGFGTQFTDCGDPYNTIEGLDSITINIFESPYANVTGPINVQHDGTIPVYYGDKIRATVYTFESHNGYLNWTEYEVGNAQPTELTATVAIKTFTVEFKPNNSSWGSVSTSKIEKVPYGSFIQVDENNIVTIEGFSTTVTASTTIDTAQYDYEFTGWTGAVGAVTSNRTVTANFTRTVKDYIVTIKVNNGLYGSVDKTGIVVPYGTTWVADNSNKTLTLSYNNTVVTATETADNQQYNYSFVNWSTTGGTVEDHVTITANFNRELQKYTVSYPAIVDHVATFKIYKNSTLIKEDPTTKGSFEVSYGDTVYAVATPETGYKNPSIGGVGTSEVLATTIRSNTDITLRAGSVQDYTIYISGLDEIDNETCQNIIYESNIDYVTVTRTASPLADAAIGEVITATLNSSFTAYHGDELTITAVPDTGYKISSLNYPTLKVTSEATIQVAATLQTYKLTINGSSYGTVKRNGTALSNGASITHFEYLDVAPTIVTGYTTTVKSSTASISNNRFMVDSNETVTFERRAHTYSVKFNGNGATSGSMSNQSFTYGTAQNLTSNAFGRAYTVTYNYNGSGASNTTATATATFNGWATSANGAKVYNNQQSVSNLTATDGVVVNLYANWTLGSVTLPTPSRTGYTFKGWSTSADGTSPITGTYTPTASVTLYAVWQIISHTLSISGFNSYDTGCEVINGTAGLESIAVKVVSSPYGNHAHTTYFEQDSSMTVYYGDVIEASILTHEAYTGSLNWTSITISATAPTNLVGSATIKTYKLTMDSKPTGVDSYTVYRSSSPYGDAGSGNLSNNATLYYGDVLTAGASASEAYTNPTLNWTSWPKVTSNVTSTITAGTVKEFKLTISDLPAGVTGVTVTRTNSPYKNATKGDLANGATIYYGDALSMSVSGHDAYTAPSLNVSSVSKVTSNVTVTAESGDVKWYILNIRGFETQLDSCEGFINNLNEGIASISINVTSSPYGGRPRSETFHADGETIVYYGDVISASIEPATGYGANLDWYSTTIKGQPADLVGHSAILTYTVTITTNNSYGTVDKTKVENVPYGSSISVSGNKITVNGTTVTATPKADTAQYDYEFSSWSNTSGTITSNRTITANFADPKVFNYTVTINTVYGTASPSSVVVPYGTTWSVSGNTINFSNGQKSTVTPNTTTAQYSYAFSSWSPTSGTVTGNTTVTGTCSRTLRSYTVNYPAKPTGVATFNVYHNGSAISKTDAKGSFTANYGDKVYATATADTGYNTPSISGVTTSSSGTTITGTTDITLRSGSVKTYTISVTGLDRYVEDACGGYLEYDSNVASVSLNRTSSPLGGGSSGSIGTFTYDGEVDVYHGDVITASAVGETGYNTSLSWTSKTITSSTTLTASASIKTFTVTIVSNNTGYGTVNKATITGVPYGTVPSVSGASLTINGTTVTASTATDTAQYDYSFGSWTNASGAITADRTITANFSRATKTYTVSIGASPSGYGTVSPTSVTGVPYGTTWSVNGKTLTLSNGKTVTATETTDTAQYDYSFSSWSATSGTVTGATSITANFARATKSYTINYPAKPSGVASLKIYLDGTEKVTNPSSAGSFTATYGSKVYAVATSDTPYNPPSIGGVTTSSTGTTVTGNISITVTRGSVKTFDIDVSGFYGYSTNECGDITSEWGSKELNSITISRSSSQYGGGSTGTVKTLTADGSVSVYYGDVVTASASVSTGYQPNLSWTSKTVTSYTTLSANPTLKTYKLTINNGSYGTVKRGSTTLSNGATITHFDTLTITPTAATGYTTTASPNGTITVDGNETVTFTRTGNTYYVYYKQGNASNTTGLPSTQSRIYPNAVTLATNSMTKSNTSASGASITYAAGLSNGGTLPSKTTATDTISYTKDGWTTSSTATDTKNYADGASFGGSSTTNLTLYPNFKTSRSYGSVTVATNSRTKTSTSEGSYWVYYNAGTATHSYETNACGDVQEVSPITPSSQRSYNTISYSANGWTTGSSNLNDRDYTNGQTLSNFSTALTLYPNFTTSSANGGVTLASNTNLYRADDLVNSYTVTYNQGNASSTTNLPSKQTSKNKIVYTANGWTTTSGSTSRTYADGAKTSALTADLNLYPCFSQTVTNQGVTLSSNTMSRSNTTANGYTVTYKQGSATSTTVPSAQTQTNTTTYTHGGWATSASGSKAYNKGAATGALSANLNLYPYFSSSTTNGTIKLGTNSMTKSNTTDSSYTVTYNYNGSGAANTTATATKTRSYTANGWTTTSGSTTRNYTNGQTITPTANITLYPCFSQSTSGGSVTLPTPTRTGHTFLGWYTAASGGTKVGAGGASYTPSANITLYAQWTAAAYTLSVSGFYGCTTNACGDIVSEWGSKELSSITVKRNGAALKTFTSDGTVTVYYGDTLTASAVAATGYTASLSWTSKTVTGNLSLTGSTTIQKFTVSFGVNTSGYGSVSPTSIANVPYGTAISTSGNKITINGTTVTASPASTTAQYSYAFSSWSNNTGTVTAARTITANFTRTTRSYTISYPAKPTGVASFVIYLNGSAKVSNPTSAGSFTASYGAKVYATATAATNYNAPSVGGVTTSSSGTSVTGNISITCTAGAYSGPQWRTISSSSFALSSGGSKSISGLKAGVPTKATFSGTIYRSDGGSNPINQRTNAESSNGVYSGSGDYSGGGGFGFTLTMNNGSVSFSAYADGYIDDGCDYYEIWMTSASVTITNIQQYY